MKETDSPIISLKITGTTQDAVDALYEEYNKIYKVETFDGGMYIYVFEKPTSTLTILLKGRDSYKYLSTHFEGEDSDT